VRRPLGTVAKIVLGLGVVASTVVVGGDWALHASFLRVQHVIVTGVRHESTSSVLAVSGLDSKPPMFDVNASQLDRALSSFTWISGVTITKRWPNTLVVAVQERTPVAVAFDFRHVLQFVDASGIDLGPAPLKANLPTLQYLRPTAPTWPFRVAGRAAAFVAARLPRAFASQVSQITVDASGDVTLRLTTPVTFILGPPTNLTAKFVSVASVIAHSTLQAGDVIDVTVPGALAVTGPAIG
jgi:cell division protein FtsQ